MKRVLLGVVFGAIGFISACVGGHFLWVYVGTADSASSADRFLESVARGSIHDAYAITDSRFREAQDEQRFVGIVSRAGIIAYELESWTDRTLDHANRNTYHGTVDTGSGRTMPFSLEMLREEGEWRVLSFTGPGRTGVGTGAWFRQVPSSAEMAQMVTQSMRDFDKAVRDKDFNELFSKMLPYRSDAVIWNLESAYKHFIDEEIDLSGVQDVSPVFTETPRLERRSVGTLLVATGRFPVEGAPVPFRFRYIYAHPEWMLYKFHVGRPGDQDFSPE